jgi:hypothetical protein
LAHSDLLPPRGTGSFLIHVSDGVTLRPPILLLLAPFNAPDEPSHCARFQLWIPSDVSFLRSTWVWWCLHKFDSNHRGREKERKIRKMRNDERARQGKIFLNSLLERVKWNNNI